MVTRSVIARSPQAATGAAALSAGQQERERLFAAAFGRVVRDLRKHRKLSQTALAVRSGVNRTQLSRLERGVRKPSLEVLRAIAAALDVKPICIIDRAVGRPCRNGELA